MRKKKKKTLKQYHCVIEIPADKYNSLCKVASSLGGRIITEEENRKQEAEKKRSQRAASLSPNSLGSVKEFVAFDFEMAGRGKNDKREDRIIEIGAVRVKDGKIVGKFHTLVDPERNMIKRVTVLTGITDDMLKGKPKIGTAIQKFYTFAGNSTLVGHGIRGNDLSLLKREAHRAHLSFPGRRIDTLDIATFYNDLYQIPEKNLSALADYFGVEKLPPHRAEADAEMAAYVFLAMQKTLPEKLKERGPQTPA